MTRQQPPVEEHVLKLLGGAYGEDNFYCSFVAGYQYYDAAPWYSGQMDWGVRLIWENST
jgi:hypothetical protein